DIHKRGGGEPKSNNHRPPLDAPVGPPPSAGVPPPTCSSRPQEEALISEQPIVNEAPRIVPAPSPAAIGVPHSKIESPELCPKCQHILPPLTADGQRPWPACWFCGVGLLEPNTELCPNCQQPLPSLTPDGQ